MILPLNKLLLAGAAFTCCLALVIGANQQQQQQQQLNQKDVSEEMSQINKSLEGLLSELAMIKREATGRLSQIRNKPFSSSSAPDSERIRQQKVSKFVLKRVAELELESLGMQNEMVKLFDLQRGQERKETLASRSDVANSRQEDIDFGELAPTSVRPSSLAPSSPQSPRTPSTTTTTTAEEAAQIGFDLEALKRLGEKLESEIEARQAQRPESLRGVHESLIRMVDNMVQNYLGNMRRALQRFSNNRLVDNRAQRPSREAQASSPLAGEPLVGQTLVDQLQQLQARFRDFQLQWARAIGRQQSPLIDRIPPRGVELWRDFWDTVRKQVRRINEEFRQVSRDMGRLLTGSPSSSQARMYASELSEEELKLEQQRKIREQFQDFYDKLTITLSKEQQRMEQQQVGGSSSSNNDYELIDEQDDEATRQELDRNVALRQQIQQEINVFGSIFDIMRQFIQRLRESATHIRDVLTPPGSSNNNDAVTPGPSIKPTVDQLLEETINSQRNINGQAKPVLLPNSRQPQIGLRKSDKV